LSQPAPRPLDPDGAVPGGLHALLRPVRTKTFLTDTYGRNFLHVPGSPGKFANLLPWDMLNDILEEHRLEPPRLRLTLEGKPVPPERYIAYSQNRRANGKPIPRLNSAALTRELREGATLVLDNVDELSRPVRRLAESLERVFRVRVQVNSYAGWRTSHGFDLHWDDHDVFILQVAGRKHWKVYGVTRRYPLAKDAAPTVDPPSEVLWEGMLEDGDLLYLPRGWWHVATPLDEPTLHLTVGINNPTGADFLNWFADRMRDAAVVRQDIPHLEGPEATHAYAERLRVAMNAAWRPELVDEYMARLDALSAPRPGFALPWAATPDALPPGAWRARWRGNRNVTLESSAAGVSVAARGRRWNFAAEARPLLQLLISGRECTHADLVQASGRVTADTVREFVRELADCGLIVVR
jgi:hypothetical protein